jgi:hypothetical protein
MTENGTKETVKYEGIACALIPDWTGQRISRDIRFADLGLKLEVQLPVPQDDAEAQEIYGKTLAEIIALGCKQASYGPDNTLKGWIADNVGNDLADNTEEIMAEYARLLSAPPEPRVRSAEKKESVKVGKTVTTLSTSQGLTSDQMMEVMKYADEKNISLRNAREALGY